MPHFYPCLNPASSAEGKNPWMYSSTLPNAFMTHVLTKHTRDCTCSLTDPGWPFWVIFCNRHVKCTRWFSDNTLFLFPRPPPPGATDPSGPGPPYYRGFRIALRHATLGRIPLDEWSAWRRDLYLTTHNTYKRKTSMSPAGFEPTNPKSERPQTHALDRTSTGIGYLPLIPLQY
jgi:hypothetical protein